jgi:hypothetical protein
LSSVIGDRTWPPLSAGLDGSGYYIEHATHLEITGNPDPKHISTSYAERANLTMRMHMRRFTRLTNAFSKKVENHACAVALHAMYYNFVRIRQTLKVSPAMAAGVTDRLWEMKDVVEMIEAWEATAKGIITLR